MIRNLIANDKIKWNTKIVRETNSLSRVLLGQKNKNLMELSNPSLFSLEILKRKSIKEFYTLR
jgi:hypothetical protein